LYKKAALKMLVKLTPALPSEATSTRRGVWTISDKKRMVRLEEGLPLKQQTKLGRQPQGQQHIKGQIRLNSRFETLLNFFCPCDISYNYGI